MAPRARRWTTQRDSFKIAEIAKCIEENWDVLAFSRPPPENKNWQKSLNSYVTNSNHKQLFAQETRPYWGFAYDKTAAPETAFGPLKDSGYVRNQAKTMPDRLPVRAWQHQSEQR